MPPPLMDRYGLGLPMGPAAMVIFLFFFIWLIVLAARTFVPNFMLAAFSLFYALCLHFNGSD